jgi:hypothetical protein
MAKNPVTQAVMMVAIAPMTAIMTAKLVFSELPLFSVIMPPERNAINSPHSAHSKVGFMNLFVRFMGRVDAQRLVSHDGLTGYFICPSKKLLATTQFVSKLTNYPRLFPFMVEFRVLERCKCLKLRI